MDRKISRLAFRSATMGSLLIGGSAGAYSQDVPLNSPAPAATVVVPAKPSSDTASVPPPSSSVSEPQFISPDVIERARQRIRARAALHHLRSEGAQQRRAESSTAAGQQGTTPAAKLPLPNAVIARTIERIGYPCGAVASITAVEGADPGVYKVTCTSGQSYQARPVHGLYHFRRW